MQTGMENGEIKKILVALARAADPAPLGYISLHTGIKEPYGILKKMEEEGLVRRSMLSRWSCSMYPMYEITPAIRKELFNVLS